MYLLAVNITNRNKYWKFIKNGNLALIPPHPFHDKTPPALNCVGVDGVWGVLTVDELAGVSDDSVTAPLSQETQVVAAIPVVRVDGRKWPDMT